MAENEVESVAEEIVNVEEVNNNVIVLMTQGIILMMKNEILLNN